MVQDSRKNTHIALPSVTYNLIDELLARSSTNQSVRYLESDLSCREGGVVSRLICSVGSSSSYHARAHVPIIDLLIDRLRFINDPLSLDMITCILICMHGIVILYASQLDGQTLNSGRARPSTYMTARKPCKYVPF